MADESDSNSSTSSICLELDDAECFNIDESPFAFDPPGLPPSRNGEADSPDWPRRPDDTDEDW